MSKAPGNTQLTVPKPLLFDHALWRKRSIKDILARYIVGAGGIAVIGSIILIFLFLFMVVLPLFKGAELHELSNYSLSGKQANGETFLYDIDEQAEVGMRLSSDGMVNFFFVDSNALGNIPSCSTEISSI